MDRQQLIRWGLVPIAFVGGTVVVPTVWFVVGDLFSDSCFPALHSFLLQVWQSALSGGCGVGFSYWAAPSHQRETAMITAAVLVTVAVLLGLGTTDAFSWFHLLITGAAAIATAVGLARERRTG